VLWDVRQSATDVHLFDHGVALMWESALRYVRRYHLVPIVSTADIGNLLNKAATYSTRFELRNQYPVSESKKNSTRAGYEPTLHKGM
jgi:hypothetical protein